MIERGDKVEVKEGKFAGERGLVAHVTKGAHGMIANVLFDGHWDDGTCYPDGQMGTWADVNNLKLV